MKVVLCNVWVVALLMAASCAKKEETTAVGDPTGAASDGESASDEKREKPGGGQLFDYPPKGEGPHEGYDLGAIRKKLQGTWMVGSTAFNNVPQIWHVRGDELIQYDPKGDKSEHTIQLLAPCYAKVADKGQSSATYVHFVFDGDTLYQGLGNAGLTDGSRTIGCMSVGMYVLQGDACTRWIKKSFDSGWDKEAGECGFEADGKVFYADDSNAKRKLYGKQTLSERVGNALMTKQMTGNKATKMASLDEALAKQKEALDAKAALQRIPDDLPFEGWKLPAKELELSKNQRVWAAAISRDGKWRLAGFRWKETTEGVVWLKGMTDRFAPPAFVHVQAEPPKKGDAVAYVAGRTLYGYVTKVDGDKLTMAYLSGSKIAAKTSKMEHFLAFPKGKASLGTPVLFKKDGQWTEGAAIAHSGDDVYVLFDDGKEATVAPLKRADLTLLDGSVKLRKGANVVVKQPSGFSPLRWVPGRVTAVHAAGAAYEVKTDDGKLYRQSWAFVLGQ